VLWQDNFNHSVLNTATYSVVTSTMTTAFSGNGLVLNAGSSVASAAVARVQTYKNFFQYGTYPLYFETMVKFSVAPTSNNVCEFGLGFATGTSAPTDGVYFKIDNSGSLVGVVNFNGTETTTSALTAPTPNEFRHYLIVSSTEVVEFWINGVLEASLSRAATEPSLSLSLSQPVLFRNYNSGATGVAQLMTIGSLFISMGDLGNNKPWSYQVSSMGLGPLSAPHGTAATQLQNYANSAAPTSATLSNTAAGYSTLGGQFQFTAVAGSESDYALFGYVLPAGTSLVPGRNFFITGMTIDTYNMGAAVATTSTLLQWGLGLGSTAVSLATTDSGTAGTRAPRRYLIGAQSFLVGAAVGAKADTLYFNPATPLMAEAGTFIHVILKMPVGTATASQVIRGIVSINGFFD